MKYIRKKRNIYNNRRRRKKDIKQKIRLNDNDIVNRLKTILNSENLSEIYKKKIIRLFERFIYFIAKIKSKKSILFSRKTLNRNIIGRINISYILDFIKYHKKYKSELTKYNILTQLRRYIRKINNEPNLNFKNKIKITIFSRKKKR
jgi:hypothetical protein